MAGTVHIELAQFSEMFSNLDAVFKQFKKDTLHIVRKIIWPKLLLSLYLYLDIYGLVCFVFYVNWKILQNFQETLYDHVSPKQANDLLWFFFFYQEHRICKSFELHSFFFSLQ